MKLQKPLISPEKKDGILKIALIVVTFALFVAAYSLWKTEGYVEDWKDKFQSKEVEVDSLYAVSKAADLRIAELLSANDTLKSNKNEIDTTIIYIQERGKKDRAVLDTAMVNHLRGYFAGNLRTYNPI
jgi:uncharacterized membrane protein YvbJ